MSPKFTHLPHIFPDLGREPVPLHSFRDGLRVVRTHLLHSLVHIRDSNATQERLGVSVHHCLSSGDVMISLKGWE